MTEHARAIEVQGLRWSAGATEPRVVASEHRVLFAFYVPDSDADDAVVRIAEFVGCTSVRFGFPNDEVLSGHPLYGRGLQFYAAHEVVESSWLSELRRIEIHHPQSVPTPFAESRHFLLAFHDSTLEAIALDVVVLDSFDSMAAGVSWMAGEVSAQ